jgi:DNA-binding transcriptional LysR family regulator
VRSGEQERLLRDGRAELAPLHRPFDSVTGFDTAELCTEEQVVVLPARHPRAGRERLRMADVTLCPVCLCPAGPAPTAGTTVIAWPPHSRSREGVAGLIQAAARLGPYLVSPLASALSARDG